MGSEKNVLDTGFINVIDLSTKKFARFKKVSFGWLVIFNSKTKISKQNGCHFRKIIFFN